MAEDADGNYYYDAGTVNELFDDISLVEGDGELEVETPNGTSAVGGLASVLGGARGSSMGTGDLDSGEGAIYWVDNGDSTYALEAAYHIPEDDTVETIALGSVGTA